MKAWVVLAVTLALSPAVARAANKWFVVESKNFRIYSDGPQEEVKQLAAKLERFRHVVVKLYKLNPTDEPISVVAFQEPRMFAGFRPYLGDAVVLGYNLGLGIEDMVALAMYDHGPGEQEVLYHECFHALVEAGHNGWPLWLNEGAAEVFSTFEERGDKVLIGSGKWMHIRELRKHGFMSLDHLLTAQVNTYNELCVFYPHSWALTHYLMLADHHAHLDQMAEFVHLLRRGTNDGSAFRQTFEIAPAALEKSLAQYIRDERFPALEIPAAELGDESISDAQAISDAQRDCIFGNLVLSKQDVSRAEYYFKEALARDPGLANPYEGLGLCAALRKRYTEAQHWFEQGFARDTRHYRAHLYYGLALYLEHAGNRWYAESVPREKAVAIVEELKKCIALRPRFPASYAVLAQLALNPGEDPAEGMKLIQHALQFQPQNKYFMLTEAKLQIRLRDYETARHTLQPLLGKDVRDDLLKKEVRAAQKELDSLSQASLGSTVNKP